MPTTISASSVTERRKIVSGKNMFICTFPQPSFVHGDEKSESEWGEYNHKMVQAFNKYSESLGRKHLGAGWSGDNSISVGQIRFDTGLLEQPQFQQLVSFIKPQNIATTPLPIEQPAQNLPTEYFISVNDDPNNPLNSVENFDKITTVLARRCTWYFHYEQAKEMLKQIELEETESNILDL
ncbi:MAG: hypothetical protein WAO71_08345 [Gallionella sp.]